VRANLVRMDDAICIDRPSGGKRRERDLDRAIARLAGRQHGRIARRQLLALGLGADAIDYRLAHSRLHVVYRGVYAVGHDVATREGRWIAAVLAAGEGAALSHRDAAALWDIRPGARSLVEVTTPRSQRPRRGIQFHRSSLPSDEITTKDEIPVTTVPRTLFDLATVLRPRQLERALNEAEVLRLWDELSLLDLLRRYPRRAGNRTVRAVLEARNAGAKVMRSDLEVLFLLFVDETGLPEPEMNATVEGFEVDAVWREQRIAVELDSRTFHLTAAAFETDRERDRILVAAGWRPIRITWKQLERTPDRLRDDLLKLLGLTPGDPRSAPRDPRGSAHDRGPSARRAPRRGPPAPR
jgi:predicted transcriptional regulator of viral defense system